MFTFFLLIVSDAMQFPTSGVTTQARVKTQTGSGFKVEDSSHHVVHGMSQLLHTIDKLRSVAKDDGLGLSTDARKQFSHIVDAVMKIEEEDIGPKKYISDKFRSLLFNAQELIALLEFRTTNHIEMEPIELAQQVSNMQVSRNPMADLLDHLSDLNIIDLEQQPPHGLYKDIKEIQNALSSTDFSNSDVVTAPDWVATENYVSTTWTYVRAQLAVLPKVPQPIVQETEIALNEALRCMQQSVDNAYISSMAAILNATSGLGIAFASDEYRHSLTPELSALSKETGEEMTRISKVVYEAQSVRDFSKARLALKQVTPDMMKLAGASGGPQNPEHVPEADVAFVSFLETARDTEEILPIMASIEQYFTMLSEAANKGTKMNKQPVFVRDMVASLMKSVEEIQKLSRGDLVTEIKEDGDDDDQHGWGYFSSMRAMSLRDTIASIYR